MEIRPLYLEHRQEWASLLSLCFDRPIDQMCSLLDWYHANYDIAAWSAWDEDRLAAQYMSLLRPIIVGSRRFVSGMSMNMAVHPDYRGRGLVKQVSAPVYAEIKQRGGVMGMGFSNADGVKVDRHSRGYGYQVIGKMIPIVARISKRTSGRLDLCSTYPDTAKFINVSDTNDLIHFEKSPRDLLYRYGCHPFRSYEYGVWQDADQINGIVIYRTIRTAGVRGAALLDAYGVNLPELLARWAATVRANGVHYVHALTTPNSSLKHALAKVMPPITLPYARTPYYLTMKPLTDTLPDAVYDFHHWDFAGGDIL